MRKKIIILIGLPGSGKTTLSKILEKRLDNFVTISTLKVSRRLGLKRYNRNRASEVEEAFFTTAQIKCNEGLNLIFDNVFTSLRLKKRAIDFAKDNRLKPIIVEITTPKCISKKRMIKRPKKDSLISDSSDPKHYDKSAQRWEDLRYIDPDFSYLYFYNHDESIKSYLEIVNLGTNIEKYTKEVRNIIICNFNVKKMISRQSNDTSQPSTSNYSPAVSHMTI